MELVKEILQIVIFTIITGCGVVVVRKILELECNFTYALDALTIN